ncbi:MAG: septum formation initiator family protein [Planctomycetota bacterium]
MDADRERPEREPPDLALLCCLGVAVVAFLVLVHNLLPARRDLEATARREEDLTRRAESLEAERDDLKARQEGLEDDPLYLERVQRRQTRMTRPGEFIVR